jgi:hypothetical protein
MTQSLGEWVDNRNCFGISYPIKTDDLAKIINEVIGKRVASCHLLDWDEVTMKVINIYEDYLLTVLIELLCQTAAIACICHRPANGTMK